MPDLHGLPYSGSKTECTCSSCQNACAHKPGWFRPGEAEDAAELLGMPFAEFFRKYLAVDWWVDHPDDVFVLSPAIVSSPPGEEFPGDPQGACVFFRDGRCDIHAAKPYECSHGNPCQQTDLAPLEAERKHTVHLWRKQQTQIVALLGREPEASSFSPFGLFGGSW